MRSTTRGMYLLRSTLRYDWFQEIQATGSPKVAKLKRMTEIMRVNGVPVYLHWSTILIAALILFGAIERPAETLALWVSYFGLLMLHECGHMVAAQHLRYRVWSIELYPIFGITRFDLPRSRFHHAVIAWGGVAAQCVIALPIVAFLSGLGYTRFEPLNIVLGVFGYCSLLMAALNLVPVGPLDGATAWRLMPALFQRAKSQSKTRMVEWRPWDD
jgi:stage IV sporulation protein FB